MILRCAGLAPHYEIEMTRPNRLDEIRVLVEARTELSLEAQAAEALLLAAILKGNIGISADIRIVPSGSLARSAGKANHVRDLR
jgi:phenylacetate-CoA ligase